MIYEQQEVLMKSKVQLWSNFSKFCNFSGDGVKKLFRFSYYLSFFKKKKPL